MKKRIIYIALILITGGIGKYLLLDYSYVPENPEFTIDLEQIRYLSKSKLGLSKKINCLFTGKGELIKWTIAAGDNSIPNHYIQTSFQIVYQDKTIIIDTPMGENLFKKFHYGKKFLKDNYQLMQKALRKANLLIFTHEHWDHTGGLSKSSYLDEIISKSILTVEQVASPLIKKAEFPPGYLHKIKPLHYKKYHQVAPGVVLIKSPGHTPGHQWIYVQLQDRKEFLFIGDTVWNFANIEKCIARPLLVYFIGNENPGQVGDQIRWLSKLHYLKMDNFFIVPNHDTEVLTNLITIGVLGSTFK